MNVLLFKWPPVPTKFITIKTQETLRWKNTPMFPEIILSSPDTSLKNTLRNPLLCLYQVKNIIFFKKGRGTGTYPTLILLFSIHLYRIHHEVCRIPRFKLFYFSWFKPKSSFSETHSKPEQNTSQFFCWSCCLCKRAAGFHQSCTAGQRDK